MKVTEVQIDCSRKNNAMTWDDVVPDMFFFDVYLKFDKTLTLLHVYGSSKGGMGCDLSDQFLESTFTLLDIPVQIKTIIDKVLDKCSGFQINDYLLSHVEKFLTEDIKGIEFDFSDRDKMRLKDENELKRYGYNGLYYK